MDGTKAHRDSDLLEAYVELVAAILPRVGVLENAAGFILPESRTDPESPLKRFAALMKLKAPSFSMFALLLQGSAFMCFSRRRIFVVAIEELAGGEMSAVLVKRMVAEPLANI